MARAYPLIGFRVGEVAGHHRQALREPGEHVLVDGLAGGFDRTTGVVVQRCRRPVVAGHPDDRAVRASLRRSSRYSDRNVIFSGQVSGDAEDHQHVGGRRAGDGHGGYFFSAWPPNSLRIADRTLSVNSPSWRDWNRSNSDVVITGAGTPFVHGCQYRPAALAGIRYPPGEIVELRRSAPSHRRSGRPTTTTPPIRGARLRPPRRRRSSTGRPTYRAAEWSRHRRSVDRARVGVLDDAQPLRDGGHHPVLHPVVHHLHEMPGAVWPAVQIAMSARCRRCGCDCGVGSAEPSPGAMVLKIGSSRADDFGLAADHQAVAALEPPHAAAGSAIDVVDVLPSARLLGADDVVAVDRSFRRRSPCRRAPAGPPAGSSVGRPPTAAGSISHTARGLLQLLHEITQRGRTRRALARQAFHRLAVHVVDRRSRCPSRIQPRTRLAPIPA